jgi:hypothetical protein
MLTIDPSELQAAHQREIAGPAGTTSNPTATGLSED